MASKYKRKIKGESIRPPQVEENSLFRESAEQIKRHEDLTGINRAKWDEILHNRAKAHDEMFKTRGYDA